MGITYNCCKCYDCLCITSILQKVVIFILSIIMLMLLPQVCLPSVVEELLRQAKAAHLYMILKTFIFDNLLLEWEHSQVHMVDWRGLTLSSHLTLACWRASCFNLWFPVQYYVTRLFSHANGSCPLNMQGGCWKASVGCGKTPVSQYIRKLLYTSKVKRKGLLKPTSGSVFDLSIGWNCYKWSTKLGLIIGYLHWTS